MVSWNWLKMFRAIQTQPAYTFSKTERAPRSWLGSLTSSTGKWSAPLFHRTGQKTGWKEPDSALPSSVGLKLQAWVVLGACWKERSAWGAKNPQRPPGHPP